MTVNLEWDVPHAIVSPQGTLHLNIAGPALSSGLFPVFLIQPTPYSIVPASFRSVRDNISQADGSSLQPPFLSGLLASLDVQYQTQHYPDDGSDRSPACGADLRQMDERLTLHLNALRSFSSTPTVNQRLQWTPRGYGGDRMITAVLLAAWLAPDFSNSPLATTSFQIATPFPYAIDAAQTDTAIAAGGTGVVVNGGNATQMPIMRAYGPTSAFVIENQHTAELLSYDGGRPGAVSIAAAHYAEIDCFAGTIRLDGTGADLIAGLDPTFTDFFGLVPGSQTIAATGANIHVLSNNTVV